MNQNWNNQILVKHFNRNGVYDEYQSLRHLNDVDIVMSEYNLGDPMMEVLHRIMQENENNYILGPLYAGNVWDFQIGVTGKALRNDKWNERPYNAIYREIIEETGLIMAPDENGQLTFTHTTSTSTTRRDGETRRVFMYGVPLIRPNGSTNVKINRVDYSRPPNGTDNFNIRVGGVIYGSMPNFTRLFNADEVFNRPSEGESDIVGLVAFPVRDAIRHLEFIIRQQQQQRRNNRRQQQRRNNRRN